MKRGARPLSVARIIAVAMTAAAVVGLAAAALGAAPPPVEPLQIAQFAADGKLRKPVDLDRWIFLGTSLGMGYNPGSFNAARPGQFQVVLMEPNAYRYFTEHR